MNSLLYSTIFPYYNLRRSQNIKYQNCEQLNLNGIQALAAILPTITYFIMYKFIHNTNIYSKAPLVGDSDRLLILIPGNPGLVEYYVTYLNRIQQKIPSFELLALAHTGFNFREQILDSRGEDLPLGFYDLEFQIQQKVKILKEKIEKKNSHVNLYFLSHSMGSFVLQRVVKRLLDDRISEKINIKFLGLAFPTIIDIAQSDSGQKLTSLSRILPIVTIAAILSRFSSYLPESIRKYAISTFLTRPKLDTKEATESIKISVDTTAKFVSSSGAVRQALELAKQEMECITRDIDINDWFFRTLPEKYSVRVWSFFGTKDHWVKNDTRDFLIRRYYDPPSPNVLFQIADHSHGFCVSESVEFSDVTVNALLELDPTLNNTNR